MSAILARTVIRNASAKGTRQFSLMSVMRDMARSFEPHPFQRLPITQKPQPADYSRIIKRSMVSASMFLPGMGLILGWPLLAEKVMDGHIH